MRWRFLRQQRRVPGRRRRLAHRPVWCSGSVHLWHRLHRLWTALLFAALATATLASALAAAALAATALATTALSAALTAASLVASAADVVRRLVHLRH